MRSARPPKWVNWEGTVISDILPDIEHACGKHTHHNYTHNGLLSDCIGNYQITVFFVTHNSVPIARYGCDDSKLVCNKMTLWLGNVFRIADPLRGESIGDQRIPLTTYNNMELWHLLWSYAPFIPPGICSTNKGECSMNFYIRAHLWGMTTIGIGKESIMTDSRMA